MNTELLTLEHEYCVRGPCAVLNAAGGIRVADSLEAATDYLEAVVAGLRDLMSTPDCSNQATLVFFAAEAALALVYASHAGIESVIAQGGAE
ncbi:hypothetical protein [Pseudomonas sp. OV226]|uniref:hypothetical protein n=1 Tax=Pseudomonas sp. OV226 TaxID=2135588 RepID=UPI000D6CE2B5|nr:hypothetical protein [Pseudomonas sp. OV226]PWK31787.1 hypothetical protein C7534_12246 [Pseudomonas sp. OV226]